MSRPFYETEITNEAAAILRDLPEPHFDRTPALYGAEVGVLRGKTASILLHRVPTLHLFCVDNWRASNEAIEATTGSHGDDVESVKRQALSNLSRAGRDRFYVIEDHSVSASFHPYVVGLVGPWPVSPEGLDFVHIDGDHSYRGCKDDLVAWYPRVRAGGTVFIHDIDHPDWPDWGIRSALEKFSDYVGVSFEVNERRRMARIVKPT